ncbi:putative Tigger transposable element-derived protein 1-like 300, partial [Homarus americanus]
MQREKKAMTLVEKIQLLHKLRRGQSFAVCGQECGINESIVRYIKKKEKVIPRNLSMTKPSSCMTDSMLRKVMKGNISFIKQCHDDLIALCINSCWRPLWPEVVNDFTDLPTVDQDGELGMSNLNRGCDKNNNCHRNKDGHTLNPSSFLLTLIVVTN